MSKNFLDSQSKDDEGLLCLPPRRGLKIWRGCRPIDSKRSRAIEQGNIASESTSNGEFVFVGRKMERKVSKSVITIDLAVTDRLPATHPGEILQDELAELELSANAFAAKIKVPTNRVTEILGGRRSITAETALRLGRFFGTSAQFWMNLQTNYDLKTVSAAALKDIARQVRPRAA